MRESIEGDAILLVAGAAARLRVHYVDADGQETEREVIVRRCEFRRTATGTARISLGLHDLSDGRVPKVFLSHRILAASCLETGEAFASGEEVVRWLIAGRGGTEPPEWPRERVRTLQVGIDFGEDGCAVGWAYKVTAVFEESLDILRKRRKCGVDAAGLPKFEWLRTRGRPPLLAFRRGDVLHGRDGTAVQVTKARPSDPEEGDDGEVIAILLAGTPLVRIGRFKASQVDFERFLRGDIGRDALEWLPR